MLVMKGLWQNSHLKKKKKKLLNLVRLSSLNNHDEILNWSETENIYGNGKKRKATL